MAFTYDIAKDIVGGDGVASLHPAWCLAIIRFRDIVTLQRGTIADRKNISIAEDPDLAAATRDKLVIASDCVQLCTRTNKSSHTSSLSATLVNSRVNYLAEIMPGDWVLAWMAQDASVIKSVLSRIAQNQPCNLFQDGLKFIGRVQSVRESGGIDPNSGRITIRTALQATGFKEFDSSIFYEPRLARNEDILSWLGRVNEAFNAFIKTGAKTGGTTINEAIPLLLKIILGEGVPASISQPNNDPSLQITTGSGAPFAYVVPSEVGALLGRTHASKDSGVLSYADILDLVMGIQRYADASSFTPDGIGGQSGNHKFTPLPLTGLFLPQVPDLSNKAFWTVLQQFLNPAVNEMYTCLRATELGSVVPHLIVRQLPFTTPVYVQNVGTDNVTPYLELPRWLLKPSLLYSYDVGRSNAMRFNFIHVYGQDPGLNPLSQTHNLLLSPPVRDSLDIKRNGLCADTMQVNVAPKDRETGAERWLQLRGDFQMGMHLTLNGTFSCIGIQAPIAEGDNLEFNGVVYHIESITHNAMIDAHGSRNFMTTLEVTHGLRSDLDAKSQEIILTDVNMYPAIAADDVIGIRPGLTYEGNDKPPTDPDPNSNFNGI